MSDAKDFRAWHGTELAALALTELQKFNTEAAAKENVRYAIQRVPSRLGNTPTICRKCYIHQELLNACLEGSLLLEIEEKVEAELREDRDGLKPEEAAVLTLLQTRPSERPSTNLSGALRA